MRFHSANLPVMNFLQACWQRCPVLLPGYDGQRDFLMDKRGEGVPIIITESEKLSGRKPVFRLLDDSELMLTIFAARPPHGED